MKAITTHLYKQRSGMPSLHIPMLMTAISILLSFPADAAAPKITATAAFNKPLQKIVVTGKTAGLAPSSQVSIFDAADHRLLFLGQTDAKSAFKFQVPQDAIPCWLELQSGTAQLAVSVTGAAKSCKVNPVCTIKGADNRSIKENESPTFDVFSKNKGLTFNWDFGDGVKDSNKTSVPHTYKYSGLYLVNVTGKDAKGGQCSDAVTVSVSPPAGDTPNKTVPEPVGRPKTAAGMPDGINNDKDALVVFPFEDMGMEGGSQISVPFNPLVPYNALNAQVIRKVAKKPVIVDSTNVSVEYSAASNPIDPAGAGSINSTSQNYFSSDKKAGANFDPAATAAKANSTGETVYNDSHAYNVASIAKTEFWDKIHQPNASKLTTPVAEKGLSQADTQNTYSPAKPMVQPDQGLRGYVDKAAGLRAMPGISDPYNANIPQKFDYSNAQQSFVAQNIPTTSIDDQGRTNPFPIMRVVAKEGGEQKSAIDAVYTSASETGCRTCHYKGEKGSDDTVWRTPVTIKDLLVDGNAGPATGKGAFPPADPAIPVLTGDPIADFKKYGYGPAVHNLFDGKFPLNPATAMVAPGIVLEKDANGIRTDRVAQSRWLKPDGTTSETNPTNDATWKLQIKLKFKDYKDYGTEDTWQNREKAALWNTMLLHDYMTPINYNNARDDVFAEIADDKYTTRNTVTMCASHHTSTLKQDTGAAAVSQVKTLSDWTRTTHAFHGKMQVYKSDVTPAQSADKKAHSKGDLIRDERGHPIMLGGRGWDTIDNDANRLPMTLDATGKYTVLATAFAPAARNNWNPTLFPAHPFGQEMLPVGENIPMEQNCLTCHTGKTKHSFRDIHFAAGMKCDSCHGGMLAVGLTYPNEKYDGNLTMAGALGVDDPNSLTAPDFRRAWLDEPDCGSCHIGDANLDKNGEAGLKHYYSAGALKQGWLDGDKANASIMPINARFAVMPTKETRPEKLAATAADVTAGKATKVGETMYVNREVSQALYRKSADVHGSNGINVLNCSTCHGGSHGIWPNKDPAANDNLTSKQLQGYDGNIAECSTCHIQDDFKTGLVATDGGDASAEFPNGAGVGQGVRAGTVVTPSGKDLTGKGNGRAYLAGPHGMHPVNDKYWYKHADDAATSTSPGKHNATLNGGWHNDMAKMPGPDGEDQCATCHGNDHKGTRLSRSLVARVLVNEKGKPVKVAKDQVIGCNLCHTLAKSFTGSPTPYHAKKAPTGGWPPAKSHMPHMPEAVAIPGASGSAAGHGG